MGKKSTAKKSAKIEVITETSDATNPINSVETKQKRAKLKYAIICIVIVLLIGLIVGALYFFKNSKKESPYDPKTVNQVITNVGTHIILPQGETPKVVRVTNPDLLKNNNFFVNSKKDDRVLIYRQSNMVILYRPSIDKIVKVIYVDPNSTKTSN